MKKPHRSRPAKKHFDHICVLSQSEFDSPNAEMIGSKNAKVKLTGGMVFFSDSALNIKTEKKENKNVTKCMLHTVYVRVAIN